MQQKKVMLYTLSTCSHCKAAKKLLSDLGIAYDYTDVDLVPRDKRDAVLAEVRKLNPSVSFPTIIIGEIIIVGNREDKIREALNLS